MTDIEQLMNSFEMLIKTHKLREKVDNDLLEVAYNRLLLKDKQIEILHKRITYLEDQFHEISRCSDCFQSPDKCKCQETEAYSCE